MRATSWQKPSDSVGLSATAEHVFFEVATEDLSIEGFRFRPDLSKTPMHGNGATIVLRRRNASGDLIGVVSKIVVDSSHPLAKFVPLGGTDPKHASPIAEGDCLTIEIEKHGDVGVVLPSGLVTVYYKRSE